VCWLAICGSPLNVSRIAQFEILSTCPASLNETLYLSLHADHQFVAKIQPQKICHRVRPLPSY
jgi:hypothetical protein